MKKLFVVFTIICCLSPILTYAQFTRKNNYLPVANRTYGSNFKEYALTECLHHVFAKKDSILKEDANATMEALMERWIDFDSDTHLDTTLKKIPPLIDKYLKQPYGSQFYPKSKSYISKCFDFYHSDDLDKLTKEFVLHPNRTYKQDHPKYPHEW